MVFYSCCGLKSQTQSYNTIISTLDIIIFFHFRGAEILHKHSRGVADFVQKNLGGSEILCCPKTEMNHHHPSQSY